MASIAIHRPALLLALVLVAHLRALGGTEFHLDDGHSIVRNPAVRDLGRIPRLLTDASAFGENPADAMYRPVVLTAHALNAGLGGLQPRGFLAVNLLIHAAVALLLLAVLQEIGNRDAAFLGALLFGVHPLTTEVANYASARSESLASAFGLLAMLAFLRFRGGGSWPWLVSMGLAYLLALGSKEVALAIPLLLLALDRSLAGRARLTLPAHACTVFLSIMYLIVQQSIMSSLSAQVPTARSVPTQVATQLKALVHYARQAAMPVDLSIHPQFSLSDTPLGGPPLAALLLAASLGAVLWRSRHQLPRLALACAWWAVCLLPTLVVPLNVLVNDHRPYLATAGLMLAVGPRRRVSRGPVVLAALLALVLGALSFQRAGDWRTEVSLWSAAQREGPRMASVQHNLGFALQLAGRPEEAMHHYERAVWLDPGYARPLTNLGALYRDAGDWDRAEAVLRRAVAAEPEGVAALNNLGMVCAARGALDEAVALYRRALAVDSRSAEVWLNLGLALRDAGRPQEAMESLSTALRLDPGIRDRVRPPASAP